MLSRRKDFNADTARDILREEVGAVFEQVLCDSGVFKRDDKGIAAFERFIAEL